MLFDLFSGKLLDKGKQNIAAKLHATEKPDRFRVGKPVFSRVMAKMNLADLVGSVNHILLDILDIGSEWLR